MTQNELKATLKRYMEVPRLSGYEGEMAKLFRNDLQARGGICQQDRFGNVIAEFPGTDPEAPRVMVFTHMDTIGFVVTNIDEQGFLYVDRVGGVRWRNFRSTPRRSKRSARHPPAAAWSSASGTARH